MKRILAEGVTPNKTWQHIFVGSTWSNTYLQRKLFKESISTLFNHVVPSCRKENCSRSQKKKKNAEEKLHRNYTPGKILKADDNSPVSLWVNSETTIFTFLGFLR